MRKIFYNTLILLILLIASVGMTGCQSVPFTGRSQFIVTGESSETQMGEEAWQEMSKQTKVSKNKFMNDALNRVGRNLSDVADKPDYNWEFKVFELAEPNAFCLPGGKVAATSGIFPYFDNDAELAAVVGHEIGHAIARHAGERMSQGIVQGIGAVALSVVTSQAGAQEAYGMVTNVGAILPYSRTHEYEADQLGLILMAKAGYDPQAALAFWDKFSKLSQTGALAEFFSTHPDGAKRLDELRKILPQAMEYYNRAKIKRGLGEIYSKEKTATKYVGKTKK
jgi:predicted Zn-dependent protease